MRKNGPGNSDERERERERERDAFTFYTGGVVFAPESTLLLKQQLGSYSQNKD